MALRIVRTINTNKWHRGKTMFNGHTPVCVHKHRSMIGEWEFTIELYNEQPTRITRFNGQIMELQPFESVV